ncbi:hypothetical protein AX14_009521 [Amanita brunnescens Koide BX004]|nr:hypothetical protein AX14_009521 [Amanita brunnescens Koide BX004]
MSDNLPLLNNSDAILLRQEGEVPAPAVTRTTNALFMPPPVVLQPLPQPPSSASRLDDLPPKDAFPPPTPIPDGSPPTLPLLSPPVESTLSSTIHVPALQPAIPAMQLPPAPTSPPPTRAPLLRPPPVPDGSWLRGNQETFCLPQKGAIPTHTLACTAMSPHVPRPVQAHLPHAPAAASPHPSTTLLCPASAMLRLPPLFVATTAALSPSMEASQLPTTTPLLCALSLSHSPSPLPCAPPAAVATLAPFQPRPLAPLIPPVVPTVRPLVPPAPDEPMMLPDDTVARSPREGLSPTPANTDAATTLPMLPSDARMPLLLSPALLHSPCASDTAPLALARIAPMPRPSPWPASSRPSPWPDPTGSSAKATRTTPIVPPGAPGHDVAPAFGPPLVLDAIRGTYAGFRCHVSRLKRIFRVF